MHFYEILQSIMKQKNLSIPDVARLSGLPDSTIRSILSRKNKTVALEVAFKLSRGLNISLEELNGENADGPALSQSVSPSAAIVTKQLLQKSVLSKNDFDLIEKYNKLDDIGRNHVKKVLDWEIERINSFFQKDSLLAEQTQYISELEKAITDSQKKETYRYIDFYQTCPSFTGEVMWKDVLKSEIEIPDNEKTKTADFVITVDDDSMEPLYWNADMVLVRKIDKIELGEIGVFTLDGVCLIKEYGKDRLISRNPDCQPILLNAGSDLKCLGKVIGSLTEHSDEELDYMTQRRKHIRNYNRVYNMVAENGLEDDEETHEIVDKMLTAMKEKHGTNE